MDHSEEVVHRVLDQVQVQVLAAEDLPMADSLALDQVSAAGPQGQVSVVVGHPAASRQIAKAHLVGTGLLEHPAPIHQHRLLAIGHPIEWVTDLLFQFITMGIHIFMVAEVCTGMVADITHIIQAVH